MLISDQITRKPPNILVQTVPDTFPVNIVQLLEKIVKRDKYIVYPVTTELLETNSAWRDNTQLLVLQHLPDKTKCLEFLESGGKILDFSASNVSPILPQYKYVQLDLRNVNSTSLRKILQEIFQLDVENDSEEDSGHLEYSPGYLVADPQMFHDFMNARSAGSDQSLLLVKQSSMTLDFSTDWSLNQPSETYLPVMPVTDLARTEFDHTLFLSELTTESLGRVMVYVPVIGSSMTPFEGGPMCHGLTIVAGRQVSGQGRSGNRWLSPQGCSMFSMQLHLNRDSFLGRRPSLIQHLVALAHVEAIRGDHAMEDVDIRIKWPNDIYYGNGVKLGGVIAKSAMTNQKLVVTIGAGLNLDNDLPTLSVNRLLAKDSLMRLPRELYLARVFNVLEDIVTKCEDGRYSELESLYYKYWLHSDQKIKILSKDKTEAATVTVIGVDEFGFLRVRDQDDKEFSVMDDGNSFDMMKGLVKPKDF